MRNPRRTKAWAFYKNTFYCQKIFYEKVPPFTERLFCCREMRYKLLLWSSCHRSLSWSEFSRLCLLKTLNIYYTKCCPSTKIDWNYLFTTINYLSIESLTKVHKRCEISIVLSILKSISTKTLESICCRSIVSICITIICSSLNILSIYIWICNRTEKIQRSEGNPNPKEYRSES